MDSDGGMHVIVGIKDNRVKIKTDAGLRVINCECCGNCGPICAAKIPQSIFEKVQNATQTSFTLYGLNPFSFNRISPTYWLANFDGIIWGGEVAFIDGCLGFLLAGETPPYNGLAESGSAEFNCGLNYNAVYAKFSINGINEFDYYYNGNYDPWPTPIFIFT
jgi:hypothetical protein